MDNLYNEGNKIHSQMKYLRQGMKEITQGYSITISTQAGSVRAGAVSGAAVVAGLNVAEVTVPTVVAGAVAGLARPVRTAIHVATFWKKTRQLI